MNSKRLVAVLSLAVLSILVLPAAASTAATLTVDDDLAQCPAAGFTSVQDAVDAAASGDTVAVCEGTYEEGPGTVRSNGVLIDKSLILRGAGADLVTIQPTRSSPSGGQIAANNPVLRDALGNIITVAGRPESPIRVDISGITVSGGGDPTFFEDTTIWDGEFQNGVYAESGVLFLDAGGSVDRSRVTNVVTSERPAAFAQPGGYRYGDLGWGIAQVTAADYLPDPAIRPLTVSGTRLERYNKGGILVSGANGDDLPLDPTGVVNDATVIGNQIVGRNLNSPPNDGTGGGGLLTTDTVFGQDGVRVAAGSSLDLSSSTITQNLMAGAGSDTISQWPGAAGVRLIGAAPSSAVRSNILENSFGLINVELDGTTPNTDVPVDATENFWGYPGASNASNTGPAVSPGAIPTLPANPVNGAPDATYGSDAVHFVPYRDGAMADTDTGYWPIQDAPVPVEDAPPAVSLSASPGVVEPGAEVTLAADASDDFGVTELVFFDGGEEVGSVTPPVSTFTITAPEACGTYSVSVLAIDSAGQTGSAETSFTVCAGVPPGTEPPTIRLDSPPALLPQGGAAVKADVTAPAGVASVEFFLGGRSVCGFAAAPFECEVLPLGAEVGNQSLRAVVTDAEGRTAADSAATEVSRFVPRGLTLKAKRTGRKKLVVKLRGVVRLPSRVEKSACRASRVTIVAKRGKRSLVNRQARVNRNCAYRLGFRAKRSKRQKLRITARFGGSSVLTTASAKRRIR